MFEFFQNSVWVNIVSIGLGVLGIYLAYYFYKKSVIFKGPIYEITSQKLVDPLLGERLPVDVKWGKKSIPCLTVVKIAFWNNGKDTINYDDVAPTDPLRIIVRKGSKILKAQIGAITSKANNVRITEESDENSDVVNIAFDYLDYKDGFVITVYGTMKDKSEAELVGTIKGVRSMFSVDKEFSLMDIFMIKRNQVLDRVSDKSPEWLSMLLFGGYDSHNPLLIRILLGMLSVIVIAPFLVVYVVAGVFVVAFTMAKLTIQHDKITLPEQLESYYRYYTPLLRID